jgi:hypothetical protein
VISVFCGEGEILETAGIASRHPPVRSRLPVSGSAGGGVAALEYFVPRMEARGWCSLLRMVRGGIRRASVIGSYASPARWGCRRSRWTGCATAPPRAGGTCQRRWRVCLFSPSVLQQSLGLSRSKDLTWAHSREVGRLWAPTGGNGIGVTSHTAQHPPGRYPWPACGCSGDARDRQRGPSGARRTDAGESPGRRRPGRR